MASSLVSWVNELNIPVKNVLHAGSHLVQERDEYLELNAERVYWFEALPEIAKSAEKILEKYPNQFVILALLWSKRGEERQFFVAGNQGSSSSTLEPFLISASHPEVLTQRVIVLRTQTLDEIIKELEYPLGTGNILVMDTQGAELEILYGCSQNLFRFDYIIAEVSTKELYLKSKNFQEFQVALKDIGFLLARAEINKVTAWGDALFVRSEIFEREGMHETIVYQGKKFGLRTALRRIKIRLTLMLRKRNPSR